MSISGTTGVLLRPSHLQVAVIGMGYVGLTLSIALGDAGCVITGVEKNDSLRENLSRGKPEVYEPYLETIFRSLLASGAISLVPKIEAPSAASTFIITVGTPLGGDGHVRLDMLESAAKMIRDVLKPDDLVILRSTVIVGGTRNVVKPILDEAGVPYHLAMCPERTAEGNALAELRRLPQIVGGIDAASGEMAAKLFSRLGGATVCVSSPEAAELAKLACNTQRDVHFAFANEIAAMCENFNLDAMEVIHAANYNYPRANIAVPGPVGGPCLEKDTYILKDSVGENGDYPALALAARKRNEGIMGRALARICEALGKRKRVKKIALLGLAFKGSPPTGDIRGSLAIPLHSQLRETFPDAVISGFDPVAKIEDARRWGLPACADAAEALKDADVGIILTDHSYFKSREFAGLVLVNAPGCLMYEFWPVLDMGLLSDSGIRVMGLGRRDA